MTRAEFTANLEKHLQSQRHEVKIFLGLFIPAILLLGGVFVFVPMSRWTYEISSTAAAIAVRGHRPDHERPASSLAAEAPAVLSLLPQILLPEGKARQVLFSGRCPHCRAAHFTEPAA